MVYAKVVDVPARDRQLHRVIQLVTLCIKHGHRIEQNEDSVQ